MRSPEVAGIAGGHGAAGAGLGSRGGNSRSRPLGPDRCVHSPVISTRFAFVLKYRNLCRIDFCNLDE